MARPGYLPFCSAPFCQKSVECSDCYYKLWRWEWDRAWTSLSLVLGGGR